eukprot:jgi/Mesen1/7085/ME000369S06408
MGNCLSSATADEPKSNAFAPKEVVATQLPPPVAQPTEPGVIILKHPFPETKGRDIREYYDLGRELGRGEFGITYLALNKRTGEYLACKSIAKRKLKSAIDIEDVRREVAIMHHLPEHPNIVQLKAVYEDKLAVHIVQELCEGGELFERIIARGHYSERAAAGVTKTIVKVVQAEESPLKAIDFGLSVMFSPAHPWLRDDNLASDKPLGTAVLSRLKQFSNMNKLKKMALRVIAENLSEEEVQGLQEMFHMMDTDGSGTITLDELRAGLHKIGSQLGEAEVRALLEAADVDGNGMIDYQEFVAATMHMQKVDTESHLKAAFNHFDKDGSGYIDIDELEECLGATKGVLNDIISEVDTDNDGRISYQEFSDMMRKGSEWGKSIRHFDSNNLPPEAGGGPGAGAGAGAAKRASSDSDAQGHQKDKKGGTPRASSQESPRDAKGQRRKSGAGGKSNLQQ